MTIHRFILEPYKGIKTRHTCPSCQKSRCFTRYIDREQSLKFPDYVGRCDHEQSCAYHFTPREYFDENPEVKEKVAYEPTNEKLYSPPIPQAPSFIDTDIVQYTLRYFEQNKLYQFLALHLGKEETTELFKKYKIGTSKHWNGATVFWQIDDDGQVRTGKIMLYDEQTGKRVKQPFNHITWVHKLLGYSDFNLCQCFFGEHLLSSDKSKVVALVESEKTALIASAYLPQYLWLASGGKHGCFNTKALSVLKGQKVILFPDLGATDYWQEKSKQMKALGIDVHLFNYLEENAPKEDREMGYDIADYLLKIKKYLSPSEKLIQLNPALKTLIDRLKLEELLAVEKRVETPKRRGLRR